MHFLLSVHFVIAHTFVGHMRIMVRYIALAQSAALHRQYVGACSSSISCSETSCFTSYQVAQEACKQCADSSGWSTTNSTQTNEADGKASYCFHAAARAVAVASRQQGAELSHLLHSE